MFENLSIYVENTIFPSTEFAAELSKQIDWWDDNSKEAAICTACYGAVDLRRHLCKILGLDANNPQNIALVTTFPKNGKVIVVGSYANELLAQTNGEIEKYNAMNDGAIYLKSAKIADADVLLLAGKSRRAYLYAVSEYLTLLGVRWFSPGEKGTYTPQLQDIKTLDIDILYEPKFTTRGCYSELITDNDNDFLDWMMHNKMNFAFMEEFNNAGEVKKRGISICGGGHVLLHRTISPRMEYPYNHTLSPNKNQPDDIYPLSDLAIKPETEGECMTYFTAHPEWYAYINGSRSSNLGRGDSEGAGDNFCTSNDDAVNELSKNIINSLIGGTLKTTDYLNFWMLDNGKWCECEKCKEIGNYTTRLVMLVYTLDKKIKEQVTLGNLKRNIKILFPVYHETLPIPDKQLPEDFDYNNCVAIYFPIERCYVHNLDDKNCTETNTFLMERLDNWAVKKDRTYKGDIFLGEYYNVSSFSSMSICHIETMKKEIPFYYSLGVRHMYYMHMTNKDWGTLTLLNYQLYQMLWNPSLDVDALVKEYFELYYQEVSAQMEDFYKTLEVATRNMKYYKHYQYLFDENGEGARLALSAILNNGEIDEAKLFPLKHFQYDKRLDDKNAGISMVETIALYRKCREILDDAVLKVKNPQLQAILAEEDMRFTYSENMIMYLFYMTRMSLQKGYGNEVLAKSEFKKAQMYAEQLEKTTFPTRDLIHFPHYKNGLKATWAEPAYYKYKQIYGF